MKKFMGFVQSGFVKGESEKERKKKQKELVDNLMDNLKRNSDGFFGEVDEETEEKKNE